MKSQTTLLFSLTLFAFLFLSLLPCGTDAFAFQVTIENHQPESTIRYPVVLLRGTAKGPFVETKISNKNPREGSGNVRPVFHDGKFKALVELSRGENVIEFVGHDEQRFEFKINYKPQTNRYYIRIVWMTDSTGATKFAAPNESVQQDYKARLRTAAELMQTFTAERMNELGLGHRTFRLQRDVKDQVVVQTYRAPNEAEHYYAMDGQAWWRDVHQWLNRDHRDQLAKNMVLAAFTRKDAKSGRMKAHTALGGGNLGLFGSGSVFSWPRSIEAASESFLDSNQIDPKQVHDDSNGRHTTWGLASTTIGATLHEMGHTFGLMHVKDPQGIMSRGFDFFNRAFTFCDPPSERNDQADYFEPKSEARFTEISGTRLQWSKWFQLDDNLGPNRQRPRIIFDSENETYTITSDAGIPWVGFMTGPHDITAHKEFKQKPIPTEIVLPMSDIREILGDAQLLKLTTIDAAGMENSRVHSAPKE